MKHIKTLLLACLLLSFQSCKDSSNPIVPINDNFIYPLKIGNQWSYNATAIYSNIRPDSIKNSLPNYSIELNVTVTKDTLLDSVDVIEMKEESKDYPNAYSYYSNEEEGLIHYAYSNTPSLALPKTNTVKRVIYKNKYYSSIEELIKSTTEIIELSKSSTDSVILLDPPRIIYKYPLYIGQEWIFNQSFRRINKKVIGKESVETNIGSYECYKIQWEYDFDMDGNIDDDLIYYEYVSAKGMLKTEIIMKDLAIATMENPDGVGIVDVKYERILNGINF